MSNRRITNKTKTNKEGRNAQVQLKFQNALSNDRFHVKYSNDYRQNEYPNPSKLHDPNEPVFRH